MTRCDQITRLYKQLGSLGEPRKLADVDGRSLPRRGVYFFYEDGERRSDTGVGRRVVRVGTHALGKGSRSTIGGRLAQHRGSARGGNHRSSIFRLLVGQAILSTESVGCASWGLKSERRMAAMELGRTSGDLKGEEERTEARVNALLAEMRVHVLEIDDEPGPDSLRGYVERNAIALLSNCAREPLDRCSTGWLGLKSNRPLVVSSGLWNQRHTTEYPDADFIDRLSGMIGAGLIWS